MFLPSTSAIILVILLLALPVHLMALADDDKDAENNNSSGFTASGIMKGLTTGLTLSSCLPGADCARPIQQVHGATVSGHSLVPQPPAAQQLDQMLPPGKLKMRRKTTSINTIEHKSKDKKKCKKHPEKCHNGVYYHGHYDREKHRGCC
ncbi:hypothetical protein niasHS_016801 [Heterodera schachtii]|uniref:Uncharacterized protein n=1 Tax=Heterodera schachtii TaxID=97005 RepID=A0ABD2HRP9_HETSC